MRRKSIGATSQAFHEPMSTGAFLEFLTRLGCRDAGLRGLGLGPGLAAEMLERRRDWDCSQAVRVAGSRRQGPVGQVFRGLGARAPRAWGPAHQGPGAFFSHPNFSNS